MTDPARIDVHQHLLPPGYRKSLQDKGIGDAEAGRCRTGTPPGRQGRWTGTRSRTGPYSESPSGDADANTDP